MRQLDFSHLGEKEKNLSEEAALLVGYSPLGNLTVCSGLFFQTRRKQFSF
jgi:hypothetical protein